MNDDLEELDNWDPLTEEYNSVAFNSYNAGPGLNLALEYLPPFAKQAKPARARTLCVKNVPVELTEVGIRNLFSCSGKVLCVRKLSPRPQFPNKTLAFVDFATTAEAINGIQDFNDRPPFYLKVNLAMSVQERKKIEQKQREEFNAIRKEVEQTKRLIAGIHSPPAPSIGRGKAIPHVLTLEDLKNITITVGKDAGQRSIKSSSSSSSSASFKTTRDHFSGSDSSAAGDRPLRICSLCGKKADRRCCVCFQIYCSRECQVKDWPQHMKICVRRPPVNTSSSSDSDSSKWAAFKGEAPAPKSDSSPKQAKEQSTKTTPPPRKSPASSLEDRMRQSEGKKSPVGKPSEAKKTSTTKQLDTAALPLGKKVEVTLSYGTDLDNIYVQAASSQVALMECLAQLHAECVSSTGFQPSLGQVCAAKFSEDQIWYRARVLELFAAGGCRVYFLDYGNESNVPLADTCALPPGCADLPAQAMCCRLHGIRPKGGGGHWSKEACGELAKLVAKGGHTFAKSFKVAPDGKTEIDLFAEDGQSLSDTLKAKGLAEDISSETETGPGEAATSPRIPLERPVVPRLPSRVEFAKEGTELLLQVTVAGKEGVWCLVLQTEVAQELHDIEEDLNTTCPKLVENIQQDSILVGDYVASKSLEDGRWYRAIVLRSDERERWVRYLDYGNDEVNTVMVPLPPKHLKAPSATAHLSGPNISLLKVEDILHCVVTSSVAGRIEAMITVEGSATSEQVMCNLATWDHDVEIRKTPAVTPKPSVRSSPTLRADPPQTSGPSKGEAPMAKVIHLPSRRLPEKKCRMRFAWKTAEALFIQQEALMPELGKMMTELNGWAEAAKEMQHTFDVGDYVCARFSGDGLWYRGKVLGPKVDGCFPVMFVDYGNEELVPQALLRNLAPQFADQPLFAHRVIPDGGIPPDDDRLVVLLEEQPFAAVEVDSRGGVPIVQLVRRDGTSLTTLLQLSPRGRGGSSQATKAAARSEPAPSIPPCPVPSKTFDARISSASSSLFHVQPIAQEEALAVIAEALRTPPLEGATSCSPKDCVLARDPSDGKWYRARVVAPAETKRGVEVQLVDYGKHIEVPRETLKSLTAPLALKPACALAVELDKVPTIEAEVGRLLANKVVTVEVVADDAGKLKVRMMLADGACINDVLAEEEEPPPVRIPDGEISAGRVEATLAHHANGLLFLHLTANKDRLRNLLRQLNEFEPSVHLPSLTKGDAACVKPPGEKLWHRGKVYEVGKDGTVAVLLVDEGRVIEKVSKSKLRCLPAELAHVPAMSIPVRLHGLPEPSEKVVQALKDSTFLVEVVDRGPPPTVKMYDHSGEDITDALKLFMDRKPRSPFTSPAQTVVVPERPIPDGRSVVVVVAASSADATLDVQQVAAAVDLKTMMDELNAGVSSFTPTTDVVAGAYVCARYKEDGLWYRARVKEVRCKTFVVCFVDYGNCEEVGATELRALPKKFLEIPLFLNKVAVQGVEKMTEQTCLALTNQTICLEVADTSTTPARVKLFEEEGTYLNPLLCLG